MRCVKPANSPDLVAAIAALLFLSCLCAAQQNQPPTAGIPYLKLTTPRRVLPDAQPWEGKEFPHSACFSTSFTDASTAAIVTWKRRITGLWKKLRRRCPRFRAERR